ncbi:MAG: hypothetical protein U9Q91_05795 [Candidatus Marinimicrobia bacterium]|nr:hypothetical protein [Candidatus Neomarinimicrobiota bacterium]
MQKRESAKPRKATAVKKNSAESEEDELIESPPCRFHYPLKTIVVAIRLVVFGLLSLRGAERTFNLFNKWFQGGIPCHVVIQNWILRFGLYKLRQDVEKRNDWVYILDHTIEFGTKKCLVVLGVPLALFRKNGCKMRHQDMEVLTISIVEKATALSVTKVLRAVSEITGMPVQILSDNGSNIKRGITDFIKKAKCGFTIRQTYDVTHKAAIILKHHLKDDENWKLFVDFACKTKRSLVHTVLGFIAPPKPRDKARWLNLAAYIEWAENILCMGKEKMRKAEKDKFKEQLSWIRKFKKNMVEWRIMLDILQALKNEIKSNGINEDTKSNFEKSILELNLNTARLIMIRDEVLEYIEEECAEISGAYPGCSDIIESVLGKYKIFSGKSPMKEVGKAVLTMPVFTSNVNYGEVKVAMENVSAEDVKTWLDENIGESLFAKRKQAFKLKKTKSSVKIFPDKLKKAVGF